LNVKKNWQICHAFDLSFRAEIDAAMQPRTLLGRG